MNPRLRGSTAGSLCSAHEERTLDQAQQEERQAGRQGGFVPLCESVCAEHFVIL